MKNTDSPKGWHNTGGNGQAHGVYVRTVGNKTANVFAMPYRCMVDLWTAGKRTEEGQPFETLAEAQAYADRFLDAVSA